MCRSWGAAALHCGSVGDLSLTSTLWWCRGSQSQSVLRQLIYLPQPPSTSHYWGILSSIYLRLNLLENGMMCESELKSLNNFYLRRETSCRDPPTFPTVRSLTTQCIQTYQCPLIRLTWFKTLL